MRNLYKQQPQQRGLKSFLLVLFLLSCQMVAFAQTQFTGVADNKWFNPSNWTNGLPTSTNDANIPGGVTVLIDQPLTIDFSVNSYGEISSTAAIILQKSFLNGGGLTLNGNFTIASGGFFNNAAPLAINAILTNGGAVQSNGNITVGATGSFLNNSNFTHFASVTNNGIFKNTSLFSITATFTNNKTFENSAGATFRSEQGSFFMNSATATLKNVNTATLVLSGTTDNASTTFLNEGLVQSGAAFNNTATVTNATGARWENNNIVNNDGTFINNGVLQTSFRFNNGATFTNNGSVDNRDQMLNKLGGVFNNEANATITSGFGSVIRNEGTLTNKAMAAITTNGTLDNAKKLDNYGTINGEIGTNIINSDAFTNFNLLRNINNISNNGIFTNNGKIENNSGGTLTNTATFVNSLGATVTNNFEVYNRATGNMTNNGRFFNNIRFFNEGSVTNNAYFVIVGELNNKTGATFINNEVFQLNYGGLLNEGTFQNKKTFLNDECSVVSNKGTFQNTGVFQNKSIFFKRGTYTGNTEVNTASSFVHTAATSDAAICRNITLGNDKNGDAKLYAQELTTLDLLDSCSSFQYTANGIDRTVLRCVTPNTSRNYRFRLLTRLNDSLTCNSVVTFIDAVGPAFDNCPADINVVTDQTAGTTVTLPTVTATDACDGATAVTSSIAANFVYPIGATTVTLSSKDKGGLQSDCQFKVIVAQATPNGTCGTTDATKPVFNFCPSNITLTTPSGTANVDWVVPSVTDNCFPVVVTATHQPLQAFLSGATTVTYAAKDAKGNIGTCSFVVTINKSVAPDLCATDAIKPTINNCPANIFATTNTTLGGGLAIWKAPIAADNCGVASFVSNFESGSVFPVGTTAVTYTAKDAKNNTATCTFNVLVATTEPCVGDVTLPTITSCPTNQTITAANNATSAIATWAVPTATDACAGGVTVNSTHVPNNTFELGTTAVTYVFSDRKGNQSKCSFNITVTTACATDATAPVIANCPTNQTITAANNATSATAVWTAPTATDACGLNQFVNNFNSGAAFPIGTTAVIYRATDSRNNQSTCTFNITVNKAPVIAFDPTKCYQIVPKYDSNVALGVANSAINNEAPIQTLSRDLNAANQKFKIIALGDGTFKIELVHSGKVLDVYGAYTNDNTKVNQYAYHGGNNQRFSINAIGSGFYSIIAKSSNKPLDVNRNAGGFLEQNSPIDYDDQKFQIIEVSCTPTFDPTKCYQLVPKYDTNLALGVPNSSTNNEAPIMVMPRDLAAANQKVKIVALGDGSYKLEFVHSGKVMDVYGAYTNDNTKINQYAYHGGNNQRFFINSIGGGLYNLIAKNSNKYLDINRNAGGYLEQNSYYDYDDQRFQIVEVACTVPTCTPQAGGLKREYWDCFLGYNSPVQIPNKAATTTDVITKFESPQQHFADTYTVRVTGFIKPTVSGNYVFNVCGDDQTDFYLSSDDKISNLKRIAYVREWTNPLETTKYAEQTSVTIPLVAGKLYAVELRQTEAYGGDHFQVMWKTPTNSTFNIIPSSNLFRPCSASSALAFAAKPDIFAFEAYTNYRQAKLQWISNAGEKVDYFQVEKLNLEGEWETITVVNGVSSEESETFTAVDDNPLDGENYYRITTVMQDGATRNSEEKRLDFGKLGDIRLFPNPASSSVEVDLSKFAGLNTNVYLYNNVGIEVYRGIVEKATKTPHRIELGGLGSGQYLIRVQAKGRKEVTKALMITKE